MTSPITFADVMAARERLRPYLTPTPLREYPLLNTLVGHNIRVWVKHENHHPTQSFKVRNGLSVMTALTPAERAKGAIGASTGNHGQGVAYAGKLLGVPVAICVPERNNPEKNAAIRALGAELIEAGADYEKTVVACARIQAERGMTLVHSTDDPRVIAGAGTMTLEIIEQEPDIDAIVIALGGGSQSVGALTVVAERAPHVKVYAVGAAGAPAQYESWRRGERLTGQPINTFAEGVATGSAYALTFDALRPGRLCSRSGRGDLCGSARPDPHHAQRAGGRRGCRTRGAARARVETGRQARGDRDVRRQPVHGLATERAEGWITTTAS